MGSRGSWQQEKVVGASSSADGQVTQCRPTETGGGEVGPLTLRFDRATWSFLKIDMRHEAYRQGKKC